MLMHTLYPVAGLICTASLFLSAGWYFICSIFLVFFYTYIYMLNLRVWVIAEKYFVFLKALTAAGTSCEHITPLKLMNLIVDSCVFTHPAVMDHHDYSFGVVFVSNS